MLEYIAVDELKEYKNNARTHSPEQLGRICYMSELDPKYCDVIVKRWEEMTGQKAELLSGMPISA